jgi:hypothetical protein
MRYGPILVGLALLQRTQADARTALLHPDHVIAQYPLGAGPKGRLGEQGRRVATLIQSELGLDARSVPVHVVDGKTLEEMSQVAGGRVGFHFTLEGLESEGKVYVRERLGSVDEATLVHEVIHVLSARFANEGHRAGLHSLVEGLTEAITERLVPPKRPRVTDLVRRPHSAYIGNTRFADALAALIGQAQLEKCFFKLGLGALERNVDAELGAGTFATAARLLERGDFRRAIAMIER